MQNKKLAIVIPTYNRSNILEENLMYMLDDIKKYKIPIYIADDSSNNLTEIMVTLIKNKYYPYIYYYKNNPSLGHDKNCLYSLSLPKEHYIWYIGDSIVIERNSIQLIINIIEQNNYDFIVTGHKGRNLKLKSNYYKDANRVMLDLSWHLTLTGATIYKNSIIKNITCDGVHKNFPQTYIILKSTSLKCNLYYFAIEATRSNNKKNSYWLEKIFDVFAKDWSEFILSLPEVYTLENKKKSIKSHSKKTGVFGLKNLIKYKFQYGFSYNDYLIYKKYLQYCSHISIHLIYLVSIIPIHIFNFQKNNK